MGTRSSNARHLSQVPVMHDQVSMPVTSIPES